MGKSRKSRTSGVTSDTQEECYSKGDHQLQHEAGREQNL